MKESAPSCFGMKAILYLGPLPHKSLVRESVKIKTMTFYYFRHRDFDRKHLSAHPYPLYISVVEWTLVFLISHLWLKRTHLCLINRFCHLYSWTLLWMNHTGHQSFSQGYQCVPGSHAARLFTPICTFWWFLQSYEKLAECRRISDWQRPGSWLVTYLWSPSCLAMCSFLVASVTRHSLPFYFYIWVFFDYFICVL